MVIRIAAIRHVETVVSFSRKKADTHINVNVEFGDKEGQILIDEIAKKLKKVGLITKSNMEKF